MAYASHCRSNDFARDCAAAPRMGLLRRLFGAVIESRQRHADRDIARVLERTGGRLTDDIERRITERISTGAWPRS